MPFLYSSALRHDCNVCFCRVNGKLRLGATLFQLWYCALNSVQYFVSHCLTKIGGHLVPLSVTKRRFQVLYTLDTMLEMIQRASVL